MASAVVSAYSTCVFLLYLCLSLKLLLSLHHKVFLPGCLGLSLFLLGHLQDQFSIGQELSETKSGFHGQH